jgi:hypothetical protein
MILMDLREQGKDYLTVAVLRTEPKVSGGPLSAGSRAVQDTQSRVLVVPKRFDRVQLRGLERGIYP